jgi:hypothetical protein
LGRLGRCTGVGLGYDQERARTQGHRPTNQLARCPAVPWLRDVFCLLFGPRQRKQGAPRTLRQQVTTLLSSLLADYQCRGAPSALNAALQTRTERGPMVALRRPRLTLCFLTLLRFPSSCCYPQQRLDTLDILIPETSSKE